MIISILLYLIMYSVLDELIILIFMQIEKWSKHVERLHLELYRYIC